MSLYYSFILFLFGKSLIVKEASRNVGPNSSYVSFGRLKLVALTDTTLRTISSTLSLPGFS